MEWPLLSLDLYPIENLWSLVKLTYITANKYGKQMSEIESAVVKNQQNYSKKTTGWYWEGSLYSNVNNSKIYHMC